MLHLTLYREVEVIDWTQSDDSACIFEYNYYGNHGDGFDEMCVRSGCSLI